MTTFFLAFFISLTAPAQAFSPRDCMPECSKENSSKLFDVSRSDKPCLLLGKGVNYIAKAKCVCKKVNGEPVCEPVFTEMPHPEQRSEDGSGQESGSGVHVRDTTPDEKQLGKGQDPVAEKKAPCSRRPPPQGCTAVPDLLEGLEMSPRKIEKVFCEAYDGRIREWEEGEKKDQENCPPKAREIKEALLRNKLDKWYDDCPHSSDPKECEASRAAVIKDQQTLKENCAKYDEYKNKQALLGYRYVRILRASRTLIDIKCVNWYFGCLGVPPVPAQACPCRTSPCSK